MKEYRGEVKKIYMFSVPAPLPFLRPTAFLFFSFFFLLLKKQDKYDFFFFFFSEEKIACYIERSYFLFLDSRINFSICCENCHVCLAAILKK